METITWKNADLSGLVWELEANGNVYGKLKFFGGVGFGANFSTGKKQFQFKKIGFWGKKILITKNGSYVGDIISNPLGHTYVKLDSGKTFKVTSNLLGKNLRCIDLKGKSVVHYKVATLTSMRKGQIEIADSLTHDEKEILLSIGLIAAHFKTWIIISYFLLFSTMLLAISKLIEHIN
ncbi:MAG: hypothetical protein KF725_10170 [Cyclobacteriaceae bacterium]|nr:hypothetical protein [Cyclobacteriaceae bacterium]UYN86078.1 MAG: hypothetical protein KIT51_14565 [Cyclobacteriaceae bacterium]